MLDERARSRGEGRGLVTKKRPVDYDRLAFLAERAKYIRELRRAGYEWNEMLEHLNLTDKCPKCFATNR